MSDKKRTLYVRIDEITNIPFNDSFYVQIVNLPASTKKQTATFRNHEFNFSKEIFEFDQNVDTLHLKIKLMRVIQKNKEQIGLVTIPINEIEANKWITIEREMEKSHIDVAPHIKVSIHLDKNNRGPFKFPERTQSEICKTNKDFIGKRRNDDDMRKDEHEEVNENLDQSEKNHNVSRKKENVKRRSVSQVIESRHKHSDADTKSEHQDEEQPEDSSASDVKQNEHDRTFPDVRILKRKGFIEENCIERSEPNMSPAPIKDDEADFVEIYIPEGNTFDSKTGFFNFSPK